jgi:hypothetical protein
MKRIAKRHLQRQEHPPVRTQKPIFTADHSPLQQAEGKPFFQAQTKEGEKEEQVQTVRRAATEERQETMSKKEAEEDKKENLPVMRQDAVGEEKDKQPTP